MTDDALVPFVFEGAAVRGACVRMDRAVHDALASHDYPRALARVLAELLAASTLLAASLKFRGSLIVQLAGGGPVRLAVVECDHALSLRATAQWDPAAVARLGADATLAELAGGGGARLAITLDPEEGPLYQGIVALEAGSVATLLEHYLASSEQLESRMALAERDGRVGGLLVQRLPGAGEGDAAPWDEASRAIDALDSAPARWRQCGLPRATWPISVPWGSHDGWKSRGMCESHGSGLAGVTSVANGWSCISRAAAARSVGANASGR